MFGSMGTSQSDAFDGQLGLAEYFSSMAWAGGLEAEEEGIHLFWCRSLGLKAGMHGGGEEAMMEFDEQGRSNPGDPLGLQKEAGGRGGSWPNKRGKFDSAGETLEGNRLFAARGKHHRKWSPKGSGDGRKASVSRRPRAPPCSPMMSCRRPCGPQKEGAERCEKMGGRHLGKGKIADCKNVPQQNNLKMISAT